MVTPRFHRASERLYPLRQRGQPVLRLLLPATPVIAGFPALKTNSVLAFPCLLSSGATRLVPRFFPTGASIARCQEFRTFGAPPRAPRLELGAFSPRWHASRSCRTVRTHGYPACDFRLPYASPRKGAAPLCTEVRRTRFNSQSASCGKQYGIPREPYVREQGRNTSIF